LLSETNIHRRPLRFNFKICSWAPRRDWRNR
jgi:hypothetical protein